MRDTLPVMPNLVVRITDDERADLDARAATAGLSLSEFVRRALDLERDAPDLAARVEDVERRVSTLEGIAGLE